jgi:sterol 24-C-methyltransferase
MGVNNNEYQISRGQALNARTGHHAHCGFIKADFMSVPEPSASFDAAYQLEATCHAPDLVACYREICRLLKPGAAFASCDWVMTSAFDGANAHHLQIKEDICLGNGLPDLRSSDEAVAALKAAGFVVEEAYDLAEKSDLPWYAPIDPDQKLSLRNLSGFRTTRVGRTVTHVAVSLLEKVRLAPPGSTTVSSLLVKGADALVAGGKAKIFSPMFFTLARKPL